MECRSTKHLSEGEPFTNSWPEKHWCNYTLHPSSNESCAPQPAHSTHVIDKKILKSAEGKGTEPKPMWHIPSKSRWINWSLKLAVRLCTVQWIEPGVASRAGQARIDVRCTKAQTSVTKAYPAWLDHGAFWIVIPRDHLSAKTIHEKHW